MSQKRFWPWLFWFGVFNVFLAELISCLYIVQTRMYPSSLWAWVFAFFYWNGQLAGLTFIIFIVFMLPLWLLSKANWHKGVGSVLFAGIVLLLFVDTIVYAQYRFHLNGMVLDMLLHGHGEVIYFSWQSWVSLAAVAAVILAVEYAGAVFIERKLPQLTAHKWGRKLVIFYFVSTVALHVIHIYAAAMFYSPITRLDSVLPFSACAEAQTVLAKYHLLNVAEYRKREDMSTPTDNGFFRYPLEPLKCVAPKKKFNVLWILSDALRADVVTKKIMPHVYNLSKKSVDFLNHYSNSNCTRYGLFAMFYGIPGTYFKNAMSEHVRPVMMQEFANEGYKFGIYGSAPLTMPQFDQTVFLDVPHLRLMSKAHRAFNRDREITRDWIKFVAKWRGENAKLPRGKKRPFFGFLFYDSTHGYSSPPNFPHPFMPDWASKNYMALTINTNPTPVFNSYKNSAFFVDHLIGKVLKDMRKQGLMKNTIILVSSDHAQEFNDNHLDFWGHNSDYSPAQTHIPLVLYWPGRKPQKITYRTQHFDLPPTFLRHVLGCKTTPIREYSSGQDLFAGVKIPWVLMDREYDYAISETFKNKIILMSPDGNYREVTQHYKPIHHPHINVSLVVRALKPIRRFYH